MGSDHRRQISNIQLSDFRAFGYRFELHVQRVDVRRATNEHDSDFRWRLNLHSVESGGAVLVGTLLGSSRSATGQVMGMAFIDLPDGEEKPTLQELAPWAAFHCTEALYDQCRRVLVSQAAWFDGTFDFPLASPKVEVTVHDAETDDSDSKFTLKSNTSVSAAVKSRKKSRYKRAAQAE